MPYEIAKQGTYLMGRAKYSPEKQRSIMAMFINAAADICKTKGMDGISIRSVASKAGYSSATLYLYFDDINQLVALASISYLREYAADLARDLDKIEDTKEAYLFTWKTFCRYSFANPTIFKALFFGEYGASLDETVKKYYLVFPDELEQISPRALTMLMVGNLYERNMNILKQHCIPAGYSEEKIKMINEMTVSYFRIFLEKVADHHDDFSEEQIREITDHFLKGARWLLEK